MSWRLRVLLAWAHFCGFKVQGTFTRGHDDFGVPPQCFAIVLAKTRAGYLRATNEDTE